MNGAKDFFRGANRQLPRQQSGFTLVEVMVAVLIICMLALTLNRFVSANLKAIRISNELSVDRQAMLGLVNLLQTQMLELPPSGQNLILGRPQKFGSRSADILEWSAKPGLGLLTSSATGDYRVSLELKPMANNPAVQELGLRRWPKDGGTKEETWVPLLQPVSALEIRYFRAQLNAKVDRWSDGNSLPSLIFISIQRYPDDPPYEVVLSVPGASIQK